jgi:glutathione S-transferase
MRSMRMSPKPLALGRPLHLSRDIWCKLLATQSSSARPTASMCAQFVSRSKKRASRTNSSRSISLRQEDRHPNTGSDTLSERSPPSNTPGFACTRRGRLHAMSTRPSPGPAAPKEPRSRARMNQIIGILDSYAYQTLVWDIYVERVARPASGTAADEQKIAGALPKAEICLTALADLMEDAPWLAGAAITLADLHAAPIVAVFRLAPKGAKTALLEWWERVGMRPSFLRTQVPARQDAHRVGTV